VAEHTLDLVPNLIIGRKSNGRSRYDAVAKRALVLKCLQPGVSLAATAMAHGVNANLVRKWVVQYARDNGLPRLARRSRDLSAALVPVKATSDPPPAPASRALGQLEICIAGATIRIIGDVDAAQLRAVIDCLAQRS